MRVFRSKRILTRQAASAVAEQNENITSVSKITKQNVKLNATELSTKLSKTVFPYVRSVNVVHGTRTATKALHTAKNITLDQWLNLMSNTSASLTTGTLIVHEGGCLRQIRDRRTSDKLQTRPNVKNTTFNTCQP